MKFYLDSQIWITTSPFSARNDQIVPRQPFHDKAVGDGWRRGGGTVCIYRGTWRKSTCLALTVHVDYERIQSARGDASPFANGSSQACLVNQQLVHARVFFFNSRVRASPSPPSLPPLSSLPPSVGLSQWRRISSILLNYGNLIEDFRLPSLGFPNYRKVLYGSTRSFTCCRKSIPLWRKFEGHSIGTVVRNWANDS